MGRSRIENNQSGVSWQQTLVRDRQRRYLRLPSSNLTFELEHTLFPKFGYGVASAFFGSSHKGPGESIWRGFSLRSVDYGRFWTAAACIVHSFRNIARMGPGFDSHRPLQILERLRSRLIFIDDHQVPPYLLQSRQDVLALRPRPRSPRRAALVV